MAPWRASQEEEDDDDDQVNSIGYKAVLPFDIRGEDACHLVSLVVLAFRILRAAQQEAPINIKSLMASLSCTHSCLHMHSFKSCPWSPGQEFVAPLFTMMCAPTTVISPIQKAVEVKNFICKDIKVRQLDLSPPLSIIVPLTMTRVLGVMVVGLCLILIVFERGLKRLAGGGKAEWLRGTRRWWYWVKLFSLCTWAFKAASQHACSLGTTSQYIPIRWASRKSYSDQPLSSGYISSTVLLASDIETNDVCSI
jgi:hypothetical protein